MPEYCSKYLAGPRHHARARRFLLLAALLLLPCVAAPADDDRIAYVSGDATAAVVCVAEVKSDPPVEQELGPCVPSAAPTWSLKGGLLVYEAPREDAPGSQVVWHVWGEDAVVATGRCGTQFAFNRNPATSPDGRFLAYEGYNEFPHESALVVFDRDTGIESVWGGSRRALFGPQWLPNPKLLLSLDPSRKIELPGVDLDTIRRETGLADGSVLKGGPTLALFCMGLDAHSGGVTTELLLATQTQTLPVMALVPEGPDSVRYSEWQPRISPGGTRVAFESDFGGDREIYHLDQNGLLNLTNHHAPDWAPAWADDGRWLAFESFREGRRQVYRMLAETRRVQALEPVWEGETWGASWAPDSERLVCVTQQGEQIALGIYDEGWRTLPLRNGQPCWAPAWRPEP